MNRRFSDVMIPFTRVLGVMDLRRAVFESGSPRRQLSFVTVWPRRRPIAQDRDLRLKLSLFTEVPDCDTSTFIFPSAIEISRSEEHTSELQSLMRISYAVFCLKKKKSKETQHKFTYTYKNHIIDTRQV